MDINVLVINVGNSRLAIGSFVSGELQYVKRLDIQQRSDFIGAIREAWNLIADKPDPGVCAASVNPPLIEAVEHAVSQATGQSVEWVGREIDLPIKVLTDSPKETGVDRV